MNPEIQMGKNPIDDHACLKIFLNGELCPLSEAWIPLQDYGYLYGMGVFETMRFYPGAGIFALDAHLERLRQGARTLGIAIPYAVTDLKMAIAEVLEANHLTGTSAIKIILSAGPGPLRPDPTHCDTPTMVIMATPYTPPQQGFQTITRPSPHTCDSILAGVKNLNYLAYLLARQQAKQKGADEVLFVDHGGCLCEGSTTNLFFMKGNTLHTPCECLPLLDGITRQYVLQIAESEGIPTTEGCHSVTDLLMADEAFLTNSLIELVPILSVDQTPLATGPIVERLMECYHTRVRSDANL